MAKPSKPADYGVEQGTVLLGKYRVDAILGHGGMGVVAQCTHLQLEERVAIKFLRDDVTLDEETRRRFLREAQNAVKLKSEHVARVSDVGTFDTGVPYMVMEFLEGIDLGQMLEESGKINPSLAVELLIQACVALAEAHSLGIVHRDIKPGNLFVTWRADGSPLLKILDFGISKAPAGQDMNLTQTQSLLGTPAYMSPEQMRSARTVDPRSDIWSLGTVLFEIIQGRRPFEAESFSEMCVKVAVDPPSSLTVPHPPGLDKVILRALEKRPEDRYQTIAEMARDLVPFARDRNGALVAVERMTRMLGRSRPGFGREEFSSPEAVPRGMMRDVKSAPISVPSRPQNDTAPAEAILARPTPPHQKFDTGSLLVGDATDLIDDPALLGEKTAITRMETTDPDAETDGTRTSITPIPDDGDETAERKRKRPADSGHTTIEEEVVFDSGKWTPPSMPAQTGHTTDPSLPPAELPAEAKAEVIAAAERQAAANAAAAAQAHAAAKMLAAQKARSGARPGAGTLPMGPSNTVLKPSQGALPAAPMPSPIGTPSPTPPPGGPNASTPIGATLPGLFPASVARGAMNRSATPPRGSVAIAAGSTPAITKADGAHATARPTGPVPDVRPKRGGLIAALVLALGAGVGAAVILTQDDDEAPSPEPAPVVDPAAVDPATQGLPPATTPAPAVAPPADESGSAATQKLAEPTPAPAPATAPTPPSTPTPPATIPPKDPPATTPAKDPPAKDASPPSTKTGVKTKPAGRVGTKPAGKPTTTRRDDRRDDKRDPPPPAVKTKPTSDDDKAFGVRDPTKRDR